MPYWTSYSASNPNIVTSVEVVPGMSDHLAILTTVNIRPKAHTKPPHKVYRYKSANFDGVYGRGGAGRQFGAVCNFADDYWNTAVVQYFCN